MNISAVEYQYSDFFNIHDRISGSVLNIIHQYSDFHVSVVGILKIRLCFVLCLCLVSDFIEQRLYVGDIIIYYLL